MLLTFVHSGCCLEDGTMESEAWRGLLREGQVTPPHCDQTPWLLVPAVQHQQGTKDPPAHSQRTREEAMPENKKLKTERKAMPAARLLQPSLQRKA